MHYALFGEFNTSNSVEFNVSERIGEGYDVLEEGSYHPPLFECIYTLCRKRNHLPSFNLQTNRQETSITVTVYLVCEL